MFDYTLSKTANNKVFLNACKKVEDKFPFAKKEKLLVDVDGSAVQIYNIENGKIRIDSDYDIDAVFVQSDIDLSDVFVL